ncbi:DUF721 domain-containing protein [Sphingosinicella soli]|uniref:DUF721 domain-containing protein n=1 Tax=Sphingosinicella soli TaxID=333708 RepID=A0A7W7AYB6_9SPHN|nr:DciA family protein [Sphingosinicella soli]MBB4630612.1 hypothetical protein [Sphingosinicella soli]
MRKPGDRRGGSRSVAELVPLVGRKAFRRFGFVDSAVVARWPEIVGPDYARHSTPESLTFPHGKRSGGTLNLSASGSHALMIQHVAPQIIERVNRFFGYDAIVRIAIRQGMVAAAQTAGTTVQTPGEVPEDIAGSLKTIADQGLRQSLEDLARQMGATKGPPVIR